LKLHWNSLDAAGFCSCGTPNRVSTWTLLLVVCHLRAIARRPKDLEDIRGLLAAHPGADIAAARRWLREFAIATGMSDMLDEFDRLVKERRP
jgi:hypothetical protein